MQRYTVYLYLETALHVSGVTSTHHQEHIQLYLQHLLFVTPLLLTGLSVLWVAYATHSTRNKWHFVESKAEIMQHDLKMH
jgi:hypothetical protein